MNLMKSLKYRLEAYRPKCFAVEVEVIFTHNGLFVDYMQKRDMRVIFPPEQGVILQLHRLVRIYNENINVFDSDYYQVSGRKVKCSCGKRSFSFSRSILKTIMKKFLEIEEFYQR